MIFMKKDVYDCFCLSNGFEKHENIMNLTFNNWGIMSRIFTTKKKINLIHI